jgi:hypothetical protein
MWHMTGCDAGTIDDAPHYFQRAIELDPRFGPGSSALAWADMMAASIYSKLPIAEGCARAEALIRQAILLDQSDPEARARMVLSAFLQGDICTAIAEAEAVLSVTADCASALGVKGAALIATGRRAAGRAAIKRYLQLRPDPARPVRLT